MRTPNITTWIFRRSYVYCELEIYIYVRIRTGPFEPDWITNWLCETIIINMFVCRLYRIRYTDISNMLRTINKFCSIISVFFVVRGSCCAHSKNSTTDQLESFLSAATHLFHRRTPRIGLRDCASGLWCVINGFNFSISTEQIRTRCKSKLNWHASLTDDTNLHCWQFIFHFYFLHSMSPGTYCPGTWDGWLCWPDTIAGSSAYASCPEFITGFDPLRKYNNY